MASLASFRLWAGQPLTVLTCLTRLSLTCSLQTTDIWQHLPCPQLRNLHLEDMSLQLGPSDGCLGVLGECSSLTTLSLRECQIEEGPAGAAAITALPGLHHLAIEIPDSKEYLFLLAVLQQMAKLTYLSLDYCSMFEANGCCELWQEQLSGPIEQQHPLSRLVNLQHLRWRTPAEA